MEEGASLGANLELSACIAIPRSEIIRDPIMPGVGILQKNLRSSAGSVWGRLTTQARRGRSAVEETLRVRVDHDPDGVKARTSTLLRIEAPTRSR